MSKRRPSKPQESQDFEINIAPIIDCFTVLITFMLISASFLSIGVLEASPGAAGEAQASQKPPVEMVQVELQSDYQMEIKLSGQVNQTTRIAAKDGKWDFDRLTQELGQTKQRWPELDSVTLFAQNEVQYSQIVQTMERIKKVLPSILLGGF